MQSAASAKTKEPVAKPKRGKKVLGCCATGCGGLGILLLGLIIVGILLLEKVPKTYPVVAQPIEPPSPSRHLGGGLDGFDSPYLGHTGSWDGKGGAIFGHTKIPDLDAERAMGLRWTFMAVYWRAMEPNGPVDLSRETPAAWRELDGFVIAAQQRGLNILMQAPVMGGNAGGPPRWAGRREPGKSAPENMEAAAAFAARLATRYAPNGTLAKQQGWGDKFGVRAWELDNEPESYRTSWKGQAADYAEFASKVARGIKEVDPQAVIALPGMAGGGNGLGWLQETLDANRLAGSPAFRQAGKPYSIGRIADVVSFHCYEGLETAFARTDKSIGGDFSDVREVFETWEKRTPGFEYSRKQDYWHTEGNYDFFGVLSAERRAAWRFQFFTRAFAAGIRKVCVMDASAPEQVAVRAYIRVLPNPYPMVPATKEISILQGKAEAFKHVDGAEPEAGRVWVVWPVSETGDALVEIPVLRRSVERVDVDGGREKMETIEGRVRLKLRGDKKMAPGILLVDRQ